MKVEEVVANWKEHFLFGLIWWMFFVAAMWTIIYGGWDGDE